MRAIVPLTFLCLILAGCGTGGSSGQPPISDAEIDSIVRAWLLCEECYDDELREVVGLGEQAIPRLAEALEGPRPDREANVRLQLQESYDQLEKYVARRVDTPSGQPIDTLTLNRDEYTKHFVDNYVAVYQSRAAIALGEIDSPNALGELLIARALAPERSYRPDVVSSIDAAIAAHSSP